MIYVYSLPIIDDTGILEQEKISVESVKIKVVTEFNSLSEVEVGHALDDKKVPERLKKMKLFRVPQDQGEALSFRKHHCTRVPNEEAREGDLVIVWIRER